MEVANILFLALIFVIIFSINIPFFNLKLESNFNYLDQITLNIIIQTNLILILSFLNLSISKILILYFTYLLLCALYQFKSLIKSKLVFKNTYYFYFFIFIIFLILSLDVSYSLTLDWDAQSFWIPKALNFYNNQTIESLVNQPNPQYPFMGGLIWAIFWKISLFPEEYTGRLFYVFFYCISLASLTDLIKSSLITKIIVFTVLVLLSYKYIYFAGNQDILIFCLISAAGNLIYKVIGNNKKISFFQTFLLLLICNSLVWTKQEGSIYIFILIFTLIFFSKELLQKKIVLLLSIIFIFSFRIFIYKFYNLDIGINSCCWTDLSPYGIIEKISLKRMIIISTFFLFSFLKNSFVLLGITFLIISFFSKKVFKKNIYIYFFYMMSYCFIFSAYILTDASLVWMLKTGLDRLIFSSSPLYILIVISYINSKKLNI